MKKSMTTSLRTNLMSINYDGDKFVVDGKILKTAKSESGVTRLLDKLGKDTITVESDITSLANTFKNAFADPKDAVEILKKKYNDILTNGFWANGEHYNLFPQNPGNVRNGESVFVKAENWAEVEQILSVLTTLHYGAPDDDPMAPQNIFGKGKDHLVLWSKVMARETANSAGSVLIKAVCPRAAEVLSTCKILYVDDLTGTNSIPWKNPITGESGTIRETTPSDGMWLYNRKIRACFGLANGTLAEKEFDAILSDPNSKKSTKLLATKSEAFAQCRLERGSMKAAGHFADVEQFTDGEYDAIVFDSARKFKDTPWNLGDLEICNLSHKGSGYVSLNAPVINGLIKADLDVMYDIAKSWMHKVDKVFSTDPIKSSKAVRDIMNAVSTQETEDDVDNRTVITKALECNILLDRDYYVWSKIQDKMRSTATQMIAGKVAVVGAYPYITVDPNYLIKELIAKGYLKSNGTVIPTLNSGEYYFNGKDCRGLIARSPLTHPNQIKVIQLAKRHEYNMYKNVFVMNAVDGLWIDLAGADMDGDEVLLALEEAKADFPVHAITKIMDAVSNEPVLNYEPGLEGEPMPYSLESRIAYMVKNSSCSKVGILNNAYSCWVELYTHFRNLYLVARKNGCDSIVFDSNYSGSDIYVINNGMVFTKAICDIIDGQVALPELVGKMKEIWSTIARLEIFQSREVDAAKTNKGVTDKEVKEISISAMPYSMIARQYSKGKYGDNSSRSKKVLEAAQKKAMDLASGNDANTFGYRALTPLGYLTDMASAWWNELKAKCDTHGMSHAGYLYTLMTDEERNWFNRAYATIASYKNRFSQCMAEIMQDENADDSAKREARKALKARVVAALEKLVEANPSCPIEAIAVACYEVCYLKNGNFNTGLSFGWMLPDALLNVFERGDMKYSYSLLTIQGTHGFVKNGDVFVGNDAGKYNLDMGSTMFKDQEFKPCYSMSGKLAAFIRKNVEYAVDARTTIAPTVAGETQGITVLNCQSSEFMAKVKANSFFFVITTDDNGKTVAKIGDEVVGDVVMVNTRQLQLMNKCVRWVKNEDAPHKVYETAVKNITVVEAH